MAAATIATGLLEKAIDEVIRGLKHKNEPRKNIMQVTGDMSETFKIRVETPEVLMLQIQKPGQVTLSLVRSGSFAAHVEGEVTHFVASGDVVCQLSYRSDKGGYENSFSVTNGDILGIGMETHHFSSAVVGQGSSEMDVTLKY